MEEFELTVGARIIRHRIWRNGIWLMTTLAALGWFYGAESAVTAQTVTAQETGATDAVKPGRSSEATQKPQSHMRRAKEVGVEEYVLVGAGDIAGCPALDGAEATAKLIEQIPGTVFAAGDLAYDRGTTEEFSKCYESTWGKFKDRTRPVPGNHEYYSQGGQAYFKYWGERAGPAGKGYYSFDLGSWHIVALNTNCDAPGVGGCAAGSPQEQWLKNDLAAHPHSCVAAYGHHALFSSGILKTHALHPELRDLWRDLYTAHASLIFAGHEHSYERFGPQDPDGHPDKPNGIREIVVGTGGKNHDPLGSPTANSEARNADTFGVLKLTLLPGKYAWEFIPVNGEEGFHDAGEGTCQVAGTKMGVAK